MLVMYKDTNDAIIGLITEILINSYWDATHPYVYLICFSSNRLAKNPV